MQYVKWAAKAVSAVLAVVVAGIISGELGIDSQWAVLGQAIIAGLAVFLIPNGDDPR